MNGVYPDEFSKIALALTSAQLAKRLFVKEMGAGEDLAFNFIGWKNDRVAVITQLGKKHMKNTPIDRIQRCAAMLRIMKGYWEIDGLSMVAEGYCSSDAEKTKGLDLQKAFSGKSKDVKECITITHAERLDMDEPEVNIVSISYSYQANRRVVFAPITLYPDGAIRTLRDKSYPALLYKTIYEDYAVPESSEHEAANSINELGFHLQVFDLPQ